MVEESVFLSSSVFYIYFLKHKSNDADQTNVASGIFKCIRKIHIYEF